MEKNKKEFISIMSFNSVAEAQLYVALLESAGVPAQLRNDLSAQIYPIFPVYIIVAAEDQQRAREIMGAKFDIDEFHRQTAGPAKKKTTAKAGEGDEELKKRGRKPGVKKDDAPAKTAPAAKKVPAKAAAAKTTAAKAEPGKPGRPKKTETK